MLNAEDNLKYIRLAKQGDDKSKEILITENLPLIKSIVRRYKNKLVEYEDLISLGTLGLVKAINNFKEDFGVKFSTYAVPMIAGEIKRFIRDDGAIKVSRSTKTQALEINKYIDEFKTTEGRAPTVEEIANSFNVETEEVVFILDSTRYPLSLHSETEEDGLTLEDKIADTKTEDDVINNIVIKDVIASLPERDKKIIILRYFRDKTQSEVAKELGVSQVQVSRLENKILEKMRKELKD